MNRLIAVAVISAAITLLSAPVLSAVGGIMAHVNLTCALIVALVVSLRPQDAVAAAIGGGLVADLLTATPTIVHVALWIGVAVVVTMLGRRIFSHLSVGAFAGLNAIAFVLYEVGWAAYVRLAARMSGHSAAPIGTEALIASCYGLLAHVAIALLLLFAFRWLRRFVSPFILITPST